MGIPFAGGVENTVVVQRVDPHLPVRMYDLAVVEYQAHMDDPPFGVIEKGQVAGPGLGGKMHLLAMRHLLGRVAGQLVAADAVNLLGKTRAIQAEYRPATPHVWGFEVGQSYFCQEAGFKIHAGIRCPAIVHIHLLAYADVEPVEKGQGAADQHRNPGMGIAHRLYQVYAVCNPPTLRIRLPRSAPAASYPLPPARYSIRQRKAPLPVHSYQMVPPGPAHGLKYKFRNPLIFRCLIIGNR
jgi:hypothetical protein